MLYGASLPHRYYWLPMTQCHQRHHQPSSARSQPILLRGDDDNEWFDCTSLRDYLDLRHVASRSNNAAPFVLVSRWTVLTAAFLPSGQDLAAEIRYKEIHSAPVRLDLGSNALRRPALGKQRWDRLQWRPVDASVLLALNSEIHCHRSRRLASTARPSEPELGRDL